MANEIKENITSEATAPQPQESVKRQAVNGVMWKIAETGGRQALQFVISIFLARLVAPDQFGAIAMLSVFISVSEAFINSGFSSALIRKTNRTQIDCSTVFYFNITIALVCYGILFLTAPFIADFYNMAELCAVLRVSAISFIIGSFSSVQNTLYTAEMRFKVLTACNMIALVISGTVGVWLAFAGWQVWALVWQGITCTTVIGILLWIKSPWRPTWEFSFQSLKEFFGFGSKLLASQLLNTIFSNLYPIVIGKVYHASELAYYNRAYGISGLTSSMPSSVLLSVTYPALCKIQHDDSRLLAGYRNMIRLSAFIIFPLALGAGAVSYPLVNCIYSAKWMAAAPLLSIVVFSGMWYPVHAINLNLLTVKGRSDLFLRLEIIKKILTVVMLLATFPFGIVTMCYGGILSSIICLVINTYYTGKLIHFGFFAQMRDLMPTLLLGGVMYVACKLLSTALGDGIISLILSILLGVVIYCGGALLLRFPEVQLLKNIRK